MGDDIQERHDRLYAQNGPCCAGCDWWSAYNSHVGECRASPPVSAEERMEALGIQNCSMPPSAGHVMTRATHHCGGFKDDFDWSSLGSRYLARVGHPERHGGQR